MALCDPMQYFLTSTGRAGCYVRKDKFDQRLASARSFAPRTPQGPRRGAGRALPVPGRHAGGDRGRDPLRLVAGRHPAQLAGALISRIRYDRLNLGLSRRRKAMLEAPITEFEAIEDPRDPRKVEHRLIDILAIAVRAVLGHAES